MTTGESEKALLRETLEALVDEDGLERAEPRGEALRVWLPISGDRSVGVSMLPLHGGIVFMVFTDIEATKNALAETALAVCAVNAEMPYGLFELDPYDGAVTYRDYVYAINGEVSKETLRFAIGSLMFNLTRYQATIEAVAAGLIDHKTAMEKIAERAQYEDEEEDPS